jgi:small-conductance mechanosensitive channel
MPADPPIAVQIASSWGDLTHWFTNHGSRIAVAAIMAAGLLAALTLLRWFGNRWANAPKARESWRGVIGRAIGAMRIWFMAILAIRIVTGVAIAPPELATPVARIFLVAAVLQAALILRKLVLGAVELKAAEADPAGSLGSAMSLIRVLLSAGIAAVAVILILANLGVDVTSLIAGLGIGGIAIGLAAQGIFSDLFAALTILFDKPFRKGDVIRWDQNAGSVERIGLKSTRIRSLTGEEIIISNANLLNKELRNFTRLETRRIVQPLSLVYSTPPALLAQLPALLETAINAAPGCSFVRAGVDGFSASSLDVQLVYDVRAEEQGEILMLKDAVNRGILACFAEHGLAFAYPTQTTYTAAPDGTLVMPWVDPGRSAPNR